MSDLNIVAATVSVAPRTSGAPCRTAETSTREVAPAHVLHGTSAGPTATGAFARADRLGVALQGGCA
jgi:hypothetical protein